MLGCTPADTPMEANYKHKFSKESPPTDIERFQRLVRKLIYLSHTRLDISFPISVINQYMNKPTEAHFEATPRIVRYLKLTPGKGVFFPKESSQKGRNIK